MKLIVLTLTILCIASCESQLHPQAKIVNDWRIELERTLPITKLLLNREAVLNREYSTLLQIERAFISDLSNQELRAYEEYSKALRSSDNPATIERCKRYLETVLPAKKLATVVSLWDEKMRIEEELSNVQSDKRQLMDKVLYSKQLIERIQFHSRLTPKDRSEIAELRERLNEFIRFSEMLRMAYAGQQTNAK